MRATRKPAARTARKRKAPAARRAKAKCKHAGRAVAILGVDVEAYACRRCDAVGVRPVGRANDEDNSFVQEEIEAARIATVADWPGLSAEHRWGYIGHEQDRDPPEMVGISWRAGWLAREMSTLDDASAWAWDISRPIAEQLAETAEWDAAADRIVAMDRRDRLDAMEYELTRDAELDLRNEDGPEVERIMAEMERGNG